MMESMNEFKPFGDSLEISTMCHLTYPCQHDIKLHGKTLCASAVTIVELFKKRKIKVPLHFSEQINDATSFKPEQAILDQDFADSVLSD